MSGVLYGGPVWQRYVIYEGLRFIMATLRAHSHRPRGDVQVVADVLDNEDDGSVMWRSSPLAS